MGCKNETKRGAKIMNMKLEFIRNAVADAVASKIENIDIDVNEIVQTTSVSIVSEIQKILKDDSLSDFDAVENIILVFEKYNIPCGTRHDF